MTRPIDQIESAVLEIMSTIDTLDDAVDKILSLTEELRESSAGQNDDSKGLITELTLACSFQDLCSQRLEKAKKLLCAAGSIKIDNLSSKKATPTAASAEDDASLLNGPALPGNGVDQDDVDRMLKDEA